MKNLTRQHKTPGYSLLELLVALGIILIMAAVALPNLVASREEAALFGAALRFRSEFMKARSIAISKNTQTAIRFEADESGVPMYATYIDGNYNGVYAAEITEGIDVRISGPFRLDAGQHGVQVGVLDNAPSPDGGRLGTEPIRFGNSRMVSFSPLGTGTPGTFYLKNRGTMAGVRVTGGSARVRIMLLRGKRWIDRQG
jgi:prepilin-type N-terminal cleavage/methylation domain-containing protein